MPGPGLKLPFVGRTNLERYTPHALAALRIVSGLLFMEHGLMKLFAWPAAQPGVTGPLPPMLLAAGMIELVAGGLIVTGLFTRIAAFVASAAMAVAYFTSHATHGFWPAVNQGDAAILFSFIFIYLAVAGPGLFSLDAALKSRRARRAAAA